MITERVEHTYQFKRGTAERLAEVNPILAEGEPAFETNTYKQKIGDGFTPYKALPYIGEGGSIPPTPIVPENVQVDWEQNDSTQPDYIKNRTHYVADAIHPDIEWDGRPEGKTYFIIEQNENISVYYAKVSDKIFTREELLETEVITKSEEEILNTIITEEIQWQEIPGALEPELMLLIVNNAQEFQNYMIQDGIIFPSDFSEGLYLMGVKVGSEPIEYISNINFPQDIQEIDKKFLPNPLTNIKDGNNYGLYQESEKDDNAVNLNFTHLPVDDKTNIAGIYNRAETGKTATALGSSVAKGSRSFAAGSSNVAAEEKAIALGCDNYSNGKQSAAIGYANYTQGESSVAMGNCNKAVGNSAIALGSYCEAIGEVSVATGTGSRAYGLYSSAHGNQTRANYNNQFVVGKFNKPVDAMFIVGNGENDTQRSNAFVIDNEGNAFVLGTLSLNGETAASTEYVRRVENSRILRENKTYESIFQVFGESHSTAIGTGALAFGAQNTASGFYAVTFGGGSTASGSYSMTSGSENEARGQNSIALGIKNIASGSHSFAQGWKSTASATCANAEGCNTTASGENSHAEGLQTIASGINSHAEGDSTKAEGQGSHAQGSGSIASGTYSSVAGNQTRAGYANQFIVGKFNSNKPDTYFEVGNGADNSNRSNAFEVYADGHAEIQTMGTTDKSITTKKYVDDKIPDNIKNSIGSSSLQQTQDTGYTGIAIKTKNPNAYTLDTTLTDNEPIGATGAFASSFGGASSAQGKRSLAEGTNTIAKGKYSHAEGDNSVALGNDSHTEGLNCVSFGSGSHSEGGSTQAIGMHAHSEGVNTIARGDASHAGGSGSIANGIHSFAHGNNVVAGYDNQFVVGRFNNNHSDSIFEVGLGSSDTNRSTCFYISQNNGMAYSTYSPGYSMKLEEPHRYATQLEVSQAFTVEVPVTSGSAHNNSVVLRKGNGESSALYDGCVALGAKTTASGTASAAFNSNTQATGNDSCAIGRQTIASGIASHSQGYAAQAQGDNSHAEGDNTIAEGTNSHAEGVGSKAIGAHSHAQGNNTQSLGDNSFSGGNRTIAGQANQFVVGKFNANKTDTFFEVGSGTDDSNRSNAFEVGHNYDTGDDFIRIGNVELTDTELIKLKALLNNN